MKNFESLVEDGLLFENNDEEFKVMIALSNDDCKDCNKKIFEYAIEKAKEIWMDKTNLIILPKVFTNEKLAEEYNFDEDPEEYINYLKTHDKVRMDNFIIMVEQLSEADAVIFVENFGLFMDLRLLVDIAYNFNKKIEFIERKW